MALDSGFQAFIVECAELLQDMEDKLINLESADDQLESINSIFRAAHTIKGTAGLFGLDPIIGFTHEVESVLNNVRSGTLLMDEQLVSLMLQCKDHLGKMIELIVDGQVMLGADETTTNARLVHELSAFLEPAQLPPATPAASAAVPSTRETAASGQLSAGSGNTVENENWHISAHFGADVLRNGMDPLSFLRYLNTIGRIVHIETLVKALPPAGEMDPEQCYLGYEINFNSEASKETIENVFEFVREDCQLQIVPPRSKQSEFIRIIDSLPGNDLKLGEILVRCGTLTRYELQGILAMQLASSDPHKQHRRLGELVVDDGMASPEVVIAALNKQVQGKKAKDSQTQTLRVDADKLDHLINLVGELVIAGAGVESEARSTGIGSLVESTTTLLRLVEEVRGSALHLRMVQIGETFNRFQRVVRDVSRELGKTIELQIHGGETELDKTIVEKISDPLMHLVRNSIDHGIESPEIRTARGKAATGLVQLNAYHESGSIVIEVSDDGGGLNRQRILEKAREKGLVAADAELGDRQIYQLIFEAGFSTAETVSNLSGRGVGMDVVRRNIEALRGTIEIESKLQVGTTMRIRLPLTLAIIDGFRMKVGDASYVVPLDIVEECMELNLAGQADCAQRDYINLRGEVLPFIRLREHFQQPAATLKRENIVIVKSGSYKAGFVVDELMGELQTVIKPLGALFNRLAGISGSTILGSGEVALILDAPALIQQAMRNDNQAIAMAAHHTTIH